LAPGKTQRSLRLRVPDASDADALVRFEDRWCGPVQQNLATEVGDFVLLRSDGFWSYQLAVVVDDAEQGVTDVVRGADLIDSTGRQLYLHRLLQQRQPEGQTGQQAGKQAEQQQAAPRHLHVPVVRNANGEKLSKQTSAIALDIGGGGQARIAALWTAAQILGLPIWPVESLALFWQAAIPAWDRMLRERKPSAG
jgi:glutamyl-Q tRNA(Asp) synthetase